MRTLQPIMKRASLDDLFHETQPVPHQQQLLEEHDVGMVQQHQEEALLLQMRVALVSQRRQRHLDGHAAAAGLVERLVHRAVRPRPQHPRQLELPQRLQRLHWLGRLRGPFGGLLSLLFLSFTSITLLRQVT